MKVSETHNVLSRNAGSFLQSIALPVDNVLAASTTLARVDDAAHSIGESPVKRRGGGGGGTTVTSGLLLTGLTLDARNIRCTHIARGNLSQTATDLMTFSMAKGQTNLGASLLDFHLQRKITGPCLEDGAWPQHGPKSDDRGG